MFPSWSVLGSCSNTKDAFVSAQWAHTSHPSLKGRNNSTQESGCEQRCGILLGLIYQRLREVLSGHSSAADSGPGLGAPWRQTDTAEELRQRKSRLHTNSKTPPLASFLSHLCLSLGYQGKRARVKEMPPSSASCMYFSSVVVFYTIWHLLPCSLCLSMLCPSQWQGHPIVPDGSPT